MAYKDELCKLVKHTIGENVLGKKVTISDDITVIEGHSGILAFSSQIVKVRVGKKALVLKGNNLQIVTCSVNDLVVRGDVENVEIQV